MQRLFDNLKRLNTVINLPFEVVAGAGILHSNIFYMSNVSLASSLIISYKFMNDKDKEVILNGETIELPSSNPDVANNKFWLSKGTI